MRFSTFILKNLLRRKTRTLLTVTGVSIPVLAVVCLVGVADGFRESFAELYTDQGVDIIVTQAGRAQRASSVVDAALADDIRKIPGVAQIDYSLVEISSFPEANLSIVPIQGRPVGHAMNRDLRVVDGRKLTDSDSRGAVLGKVLASQLGKGLGDTVDVFGESFTVVGVVESFNVFENGSLFVTLAALQQVLNLPGRVTGFSIVVESGPGKPEAVKEICKTIESMPGPEGKPLGLSAMPMRDFLTSTMELKTATAMAWVTSAVALIVGGIGMLNTMIMSVFERTREIGILRAIGWRRWRIIRMILGEALVLSLCGAVIGTLLGAAAITILAEMPDASLVVSGKVHTSAVVQGFAIALLVGIVGGTYPAFRAAGMSPTEAIRHE